MRDLFKILVVGIVLAVAPYSKAEEYRVLVLPDNIVTETEAIDAYIYNSTSEFFANEVVNILNQTDFIKSPTVSEERKLLKSSPEYLIPARNLTNRYKTTYNIDFVQLGKIAKKNDIRYVLLLTSSTDSENYILRRTTWDFLNVPGATVVDPAYKISTYASLVDTSNNTVLWSDTYYKTISSIENRIITRGPSPQTEQLQKIRDYSRSLCPEIAQNVQEKVLPPEVLAEESKKVYYDIGNFDNTFTKKYRRTAKEGKKVYNVAKENVEEAYATTKVVVGETAAKVKDGVTEGVNTAKTKVQEEIQKRKEAKELESKLEVKAEPVSDVEETPEVKKKWFSLPEIKMPQFFKSRTQEENIQNINYVVEPDVYSTYEGIEIQRTKKNNLYGEYDPSRPPLRDYN